MDRNSMQQEFLDIFRFFDRIGDAVKWIAKVTKSSESTVNSWRCKSKITPRAYALLAQAAKKNNRICKKVSTQPNLECKF